MNIRRLNLDDPLICFFVRYTAFDPGAVAIVYAEEREQCKRILQQKLHEERISGYLNPDKWTITPLTPAPAEPKAQLL